MFVTSDDYLSQVSRVIADGEEVSIAVAFLGEGAERLFDGITKPVKLLCNLMSGATNPDVVERLRDNPMVHVKHLADLHAKVLHTPTEALIGSANLSANGLNLEGEEGAGWREAGYLVRDAVQLHEIRRWFEQQWDDHSARDVGDADLAEARRRWELRRAGRVAATSKTARLIDTPVEQLKGLPIYVVLYNREASTLGTEAGNACIEAATSELNGDGELDGKLSFFEHWPALPKEASLLCFWYGSRLGLQPEGAWRRVPQLDKTYRADGQDWSVEIVVAEDAVGNWSYNGTDANALAKLLKPVMKPISALAGEHGEIVLPLHQALAMARSE